MPHGITQCYLPPGRGDIPALTPSRSWYSIKRPRRDARLSWPSCVCLSVRDLRNYTSDLHQMFRACYYGRGSVLLWRLGDMKVMQFRFYRLRLKAPTSTGQCRWKFHRDRRDGCWDRHFHLFSMAAVRRLRYIWRVYGILQYLMVLRNMFKLIWSHSFDNLKVCVDLFYEFGLKMPICASIFKELMGHMTHKQRETSTVDNLDLQT